MVPVNILFSRDDAAHDYHGTLLVMFPCYCKVMELSMGFLRRWAFQTCKGLSWLLWGFLERGKRGLRVLVLGF